MNDFHKYCVNVELAEAVQKQTGITDLEEFKQTLKEVVDHGSNHGVPGFTYTSDCVNFWREHRDMILNELMDYAEKTYTTVLDLVKGWKFVTATEGEVVDALLSKYYKPKYDDIYEALAWFALDHVAYPITEYHDDEEYYNEAGQ